MAKKKKKKQIKKAVKKAPKTLKVLLVLVFLVILIGAAAYWYFMPSTVKFTYENEVIHTEEVRLGMTIEYIPTIEDIKELNKFEFDENDRIIWKNGNKNISKSDRVWTSIDYLGEKVEGFTYSGDYYNDISVVNRSTLGTLVNKNVSLISYEEAKEVLAVADKAVDENGNEYLLGMYESRELVPYWNAESGKAWEREHVWPNSRLGMDRVAETNRNQASDAHNLRAIGGTKTGGINQTRSNRYFLDGEGECKTVGKEGFYPGDSHKGDVARILLYMYVKYDFLKLTTSLTFLDSAVAYAADDAYMGDLSLLLKWHQEDPVDEFEFLRNERIYEYQNNRNPFIDNPSWFETIYNLVSDDKASVSFNLVEEILFERRNKWMS